MKLIIPILSISTNIENGNHGNPGGTTGCLFPGPLPGLGLHCPGHLDWKRAVKTYGSGRFSEWSSFFNFASTLFLKSFRFASKIRIPMAIQITPKMRAYRLR
jgi:hypothetical protein